MAVQPRTASAAAIASSQPSPPSGSAPAPVPEGGRPSAVDGVTSAGEVVVPGPGVRPEGDTVSTALGVGRGVALAAGVLVPPGMGEAVGVCL